MAYNIFLVSRINEFVQYCSISIPNALGILQCCTKPSIYSYGARGQHIQVNSLRPSDAYITIIASDNGLSPGRRQAIIWTSAGILLIGPLGTNFSEIFIEIITFSFKKMRLKVSSAKWRPCRSVLNVLSTMRTEEMYSIMMLIKFSDLSQSDR